LTHIENKIKKNEKIEERVFFGYKVKNYGNNVVGDCKKVYTQKHHKGEK